MTSKEQKLIKQLGASIMVNNWSGVKLPSFYEPPARRRITEKEEKEYYSALA